MPCKVEFDAPDCSWYCCNCGDGPMDFNLFRSCIGCNDHKFCIAAITPPDSPLPSYSYYAKVEDDRVPIVASESPPPSSASLSSLCRDKRLSTLSCRGGKAEKQPLRDIPAIPLDDEDQCLHATIDRESKSIVDFQLSLSSLTDLISTSEFRSCLSGERSTHRTQPGPSKSPSKQSGRKQRQGGGRKGPIDQRDDLESENEESNRQPGGKPRRRPDEASIHQFACPFLVYNPHRYRHFKGCRHGYASISELKEHLTRKGSTHKLHECNTCYDVFSNEVELDEHERIGQHSEPSPLYYPAEGIGSRRQGMIRKSKGVGIDSWGALYRILFGEDVDVPSSDFNEADAIRRSNEPSLQDEFYNKLVQTLQRTLPESNMRTVLRLFFLSYIEAAACRIKASLGGEDEFAVAHDVLSQPVDVKNKRVLRDTGQYGMTPPHQSEAEKPTVCTTPPYRGEPSTEASNSFSSTPNGEHTIARADLSNCNVSPTIPVHQTPDRSSPLHNLPSNENVTTTNHQNNNTFPYLEYGDPLCTLTLPTDERLPTFSMGNNTSMPTMLDVGPTDLLEPHEGPPNKRIKRTPEDLRFEQTADQTVYYHDQLSLFPDSHRAAPLPADHPLGLGYTSAQTHEPPGGELQPLECWGSGMTDAQVEDYEYRTYG